MARSVAMRWLLICVWTLAACSGDDEGDRKPGGDGDGDRDGSVRDGEVPNGDGDGDGDRDGGTDGGQEASGCGDGVIQPGEACDDKNNQGGDGCAPDCDSVEPLFACPMPGEPCVSTVRCGNGVIEGNEECDDANRNFKDGCDTDCALEAGWVCPAPGSRCAAAECGDGIIAGKEQCEDDDGATPTDADGCSATCMKEPGYECDAAGTACRLTVCNDGTKEGSEPCDDGNQIIGDGCNPFCEVEPSCTAGAGCHSNCGDGLILPTDSEECDDGNTQSGDGCSATCKEEDGWTCTVVAGTLPDPLLVPVVYRDFIRAPDTINHPDFETFSGNDISTNLVAPTLTNGKPVLSGNCDFDGPYTNPPCAQGHQQVTTQANFAQWYTDVPAVNKTFVTHMPLDSIGPGVYQIDNGAFFPIDNMGWVVDATTPETEENDHNFGFTSEIRTWFEYNGGEMLEFSGDDDVWVFINGQLAVDIGGLHSVESGSITLDANAATNLGLTIGNVYEIVLFHAERHTGASNFKLTLAGFVTAKSECETDCGDMVVAGDEECDDGVNDGSYGSCTADCKRGPFCGDAVKQDPPELCDVGNNLISYSADGMGCAPGCIAPSYCGDSTVDGLFGEECDDGDNPGGYGECAPDCTLGPRCGDRKLQADEDEQCDDGNLVNHDGCDDKCKPEGPE